MSFRRLCNLLLKKTSPILYTTTSIFVSCSEASEPKTNGKIQWDPPDFSKFTHENMIKQSTIDTVNSVSQALTITYIAIENTSNEYRRSLALLMSLIRDTLVHRVTDSHWDLIIAARAEVQKKKRKLIQLIEYMAYVQKMAVATTEAGYMAGMDSLSITLSQRMDDALNSMTKQIKDNEILEKEYNILQEECIRKTNTAEALKENKAEDGDAETIFVD